MLLNFNKQRVPSSGMMLDQYIMKVSKSIHHGVDL